MSRVGTVRNVVIVLALAAAVEFLPGGGRAADTFRSVLWVAFAAGLGYMGVRLYREHRISLYSLGARHRGMLYGAIALGAVLIAARTRMWQTGGGELAWFVLLGLAAYLLMVVYRFWRSY
jgi:hypothetical protein